MLSVSDARGTDRTVVLDFICATHESAHRVALDLQWDGPVTLPADCRNLSKRGFQGRIARIVDIVDVLRIGPDDWIEIGKVLRNSAESGYSAGIAEELLTY